MLSIPIHLPLGTKVRLFPVATHALVSFVNLGLSYPNATGDHDLHSGRIEQSADMIIMSLAHAQTTGNGSLILQYVSLRITNRLR